jgi:predicted ATPase/DNA-binding XRE family transcriptional regulator
MSVPVSAPPSETFGSLLRRLRLERKLSQGKLAERAQMSVEAISALERGFRRSPQQSTIALLVAALELDPPDARSLETIAEPRVGRKGTSERAEMSRRALGNPPTVTDEIIGRENDLRALDDLCSQHRIVTLAGPGGVGKTRLVVALAARRADRYADGVVFVDLSPVYEPDAIVTALAEALDVPLAPGEPASQYSSIIGHRNLLVIFDNCEHVTAGVAGLIRTLWTPCPAVSFICTSRQPIEIAGETIFRLSPLDDDAAVALFKSRARSVDARFASDGSGDEQLRELCKKIDNLPLAIELVAARTTALTIPDLLRRIDRPLRLVARPSSAPRTRQQTLRTTLDWSFDLLDARERRFFCGLSIFCGGWTLESAHAVAGDDGTDDFETLEMLESLVAKSLVVVVPGVETRYRMLETIRAYGLERVTEAGEREARVRRFIRFFRDVVASIEAIADHRSQFDRLERLVADRENYRAAMRVAIENDPGDAFVLYTTEFGIAWAGIATEVCVWAAQLRPFLHQQKPDTVFHFWRRTILATRFGDVPYDREDFVAMLDCLIASARESDDPSNIVRALAFLVFDYIDQGTPHAAEPLLAEARRQRGISPIATLQLLDVEGEWALACGDRSAAKTQYTEMLRLGSDISDARLEFLATEMLFEIALEERDLFEAQRLARAAESRDFDSFSWKRRISFAGLPEILWFAGNERRAYRIACEMIAGYDAYYLQKESEVRILALASARVGRFESAARLGGFASRIALPRETSTSTSKARTAYFQQLLRSIVIGPIESQRFDALLAEGALLDHATARKLGSNLTVDEFARLAG